MKTTLKLKDSNGLAVKGWYFETFNGWNLTSGQKSRKVKGWQIVSHDGCVRFNEGNWEQFVPFARVIISNYGFTGHIS